MSLISSSGFILLDICSYSTINNSIGAKVNCGISTGVDIKAISLEGDRVDNEFDIPLYDVSGRLLLLCFILCISDSKNLKYKDLTYNSLTFLLVF